MMKNENLFFICRAVVFENLVLICITISVNLVLLLKKHRKSIYMYKYIGVILNSYSLLGSFIAAGPFPSKGS